MPGSKSISNRVLLLAALAEGETRVENLLDSDDTRAMLNALELLGVRIERDSATVRGGPFPNKSGDLHLGNAGTAFRPLTAVLALAGGEYRLSGSPRMHERPIGDLVDALRALGARIDYLGKEGFPPLALHPGTIRRGASLRVRGDVSSQYLSALLMAAPLAESETRIEVEGELISKPYVEITVDIMRRFADGPSTLRNIASWRVKETDRIAAMAAELRKLGAAVEEGADALRVTPPTALRPATIATYGDHRMAMSFSLAALGGIRVRIEDPDCVAKTFPEYFAALAGISRRVPA